MTANKVVLNGKVILDLTADTVTDPDVKLGKTFHKADGSRNVGTHQCSNESAPIPEWDWSPDSYTITGGEE